MVKFFWAKYRSKKSERFTFFVVKNYVFYNKKSDSRIFLDRFLV